MSIIVTNALASLVVAKEVLNAVRPSYLQDSLMVSKLDSPFSWVEFNAAFYSKVGVTRERFLDTSRKVMPSAISTIIHEFFFGQGFVSVDNFNPVEAEILAWSRLALITEKEEDIETWLRADFDAATKVLKSVSLPILDVVRCAEPLDERLFYPNVAMVVVPWMLNHYAELSKFVADGLHGGIPADGDVKKTVASLVTQFAMVFNQKHSSSPQQEKAPNFEDEEDEDMDDDIVQHLNSLQVGGNPAIDLRSNRLSGMTQLKSSLNSSSSSSAGIGGIPPPLNPPPPPPTRPTAPESKRYTTVSPQTTSSSSEHTGGLGKVAVVSATKVPARKSFYVASVMAPLGAGEVGNTFVLYVTRELINEALKNVKDNNQLPFGSKVTMIRYLGTIAMNEQDIIKLIQFASANGVYFEDFDQYGAMTLDHYINGLCSVAATRSSKNEDEKAAKLFLYSFTMLNMSVHPNSMIDYFEFQTGSLFHDPKKAEAAFGVMITNYLCAVDKEFAFFIHDGITYDSIPELRLRIGNLFPNAANMRTIPSSLPPRIAAYIFQSNTGIVKYFNSTCSAFDTKRFVKEISILDRTRAFDIAGDALSLGTKAVTDTTPYYRCVEASSVSFNNNMVVSGFTFDNKYPDCRSCFSERMVTHSVAGPGAAPKKKEHVHLFDGKVHVSEQYSDVGDADKNAVKIAYSNNKKRDTVLRVNAVNVKEKVAVDLKRFNNQHKDVSSDGKKSNTANTTTPVDESGTTTILGGNLAMLDDAVALDLCTDSHCSYLEPSTPVDDVHNAPSPSPPVVLSKPIAKETLQPQDGERCTSDCGPFCNDPIDEVKVEEVVKPVRRAFLNALCAYNPLYPITHGDRSVLRQRLRTSVTNTSINNNNNDCGDNSNNNTTSNACNSVNNINNKYNPNALHKLVLINNTNVKRKKNSKKKSTTKPLSPSVAPVPSQDSIVLHDDSTSADYISNSIHHSTDSVTALVDESLNHGFHGIVASIGLGARRSRKTILADSGSTASVITLDALKQLGVKYTTEQIDIEMHKDLASNYTGYGVLLEVTYNNTTTKVGFLVFKFIDNPSGILLSMHDSFRVGVKHMHSLTEKVVRELTRKSRLALMAEKDIPEGKQIISPSKRISLLIEVNEGIPPNGIVNFAQDGLVLQFKNEFYDGKGVANLPETSPPHIFSSKQYTKIHEQIEAQIDEWLKAGVVSEVRLSPNDVKHCAPLVPVSVDGKKLRICSDFRNLNEYVVVSANNIPLISDAVQWAAQFEVLSSFDMKAGYFQMPLNVDSRKFARFFWKAKFYEYNRVPFGINSAPTFFHGLVAKQFADDPNVFVYFDNIYIGSSRADAQVVLERVLKKCNELNIKLNMTKTELFQDHIDMLGFRVGFNNISIHPKRVQTIMGLKRPGNRKQMQSFIGLVTYNRKHIVHCNVILDLLHQEAARLETPSAKVDWTPELIKAYESCKKGLIGAITMHTMFPDEVAHIYSDASGRGVGGFLCVFRGDECIPIDFFSEYLSQHQQTWNTTHREYAAAVKAAEYWQQLLYGRKVVVHVDHKALLAGAQWALETPLFARWSRVLADLDVDFMWLPGEQNVVADALSRLDRDEPVLKEDAFFSAEEAKLLAEQSDVVADRAVARLNVQNVRPPPMAADVTRKHKSLLVDVKFDDNPLTPIIDEEKLCQYLRPVAGTKTYEPVYLDYRVQVPHGWIPTDETLKEWCKLAHVETVHGGVAAVTAYLVHKQRLPPGASEIINNTTAACAVCANLKRKNAVQWEKLTVEARFPLEKVQMDLFHPVPGASAIIIVDVYSGFTWTKVLADSSGNEVGNALLEYISIFGVPNSIHSDQGPEFVNAGIRFLSEAIPFHHTVSVANRPVGRGIVEGRIRLIKDKLTFAIADINNWRLGLVLATAALNRADRANKPSPEYLMYGRKTYWLAANLSSAFDANWNDYINDRVVEFDNRARYEKDVVYQKSIVVGDVVYARNLTYSGRNDFYYHGPYIVTSVDVRNNLYIENPFGHSHPMPVHYSTCYRYGNVDFANKNGLFDKPKVHAVVAHSVNKGSLYLRIQLWGFRTDETVWIKYSTVKHLKVVQEYALRNELVSKHNNDK